MKKQNKNVLQYGSGIVIIAVLFAVWLFLVYASYKISIIDWQAVPASRVAGQSTPKADFNNTAKQNPSQESNPKNNIGLNIILFTETLELLDRYYYQDVDLDELTHKVLKQMISELDPYSALETYNERLEKYTKNLLNSSPDGHQEETEWRLIKINKGEIGYIRIYSFLDIKSVQIFKDAIKGCKDRKVKGIIIDLRDNPGGYKDDALDMLESLLPPDTLLMTVKLKTRNEIKYVTDKENKGYWIGPMVVLVNENSSSMSEVFVGILKDHKKAIVVGQTTYGKGVMQGEFELYDKSLLTLTTTFVYLPISGSFHGKGIEPHIKMDTADDEKLIEKAKEVLQNWEEYENLYLK